MSRFSAKIEPPDVVNDNNNFFGTLMPVVLDSPACFLVYKILPEAALLSPSHLHMPSALTSAPLFIGISVFHLSIFQESYPDFVHPFWLFFLLFRLRSVSSIHFLAWL